MKKKIYLASAIADSMFTDCRQIDNCVIYPSAVTVGRLSQLMEEDVTVISAFKDKDGLIVEALNTLGLGIEIKGEWVRLMPGDTVYVIDAGININMLDPEEFLDPSNLRVHGYTVVQQD